MTRTAIRAALAGLGVLRYDTRNRLFILTRRSTRQESPASLERALKLRIPGAYAVRLRFPIAKDPGVSVAEVAFNVPAPPAAPGGLLATRGGR